MDILKSPPLALSLVLASFYAGLFHLIWGQLWGEFVLYWITAIIGFGLGQAIGNVIGLNVLMVGEVHLLETSLVCWGALFVAKWLKV